MRAYPFLGKFVVTSLFGVRGQIKTSEGYASRNHKGIDVVGQGDINVVACEGGVVKRAQYGNGVGNYVWVATDSGYGTIYQHLKSISVKVGDRVTCKQKLGVMGNTGNSSGPHLHFGVATNPEFRSYNDNDWVNPAIWWGINNPGTIKGKTFNGNGYISGNPSGVTPENNNDQSITVENSSSSSGGYLDSLVPSGEFYEATDMVGTLGDWLYGRRYRILVDIGGGKAFDVSELRCSFEIVKTAYLEANQSILSIYNLNPEDENKLIKQGQRIIIEAGYQGSQYGLIFSGNVIQPLRSKENGVDYLLTLVSMDADRYATYGLVVASLVAQQTSRDAIQVLMTKSSQEVGAGFLTNTNIVYPRGKVMFGMSKNYLAQIARSENATYYTEDGKVNIISAADVKKGQILDFGPQTGLIGTPTQTEMGIECTVLLNPQVHINTLFHIDNKRVTNYRYTPGQPVRSLDSQGIYRVIKLTHVGDTRTNEWFTKIEAISQAGLLPGMMAGSSIYAW
jgi:hypothetical protein